MSPFLMFHSVMSPRIEPSCSEIDLKLSRPRASFKRNSIHFSCSTRESVTCSETLRVRSANNSLSLFIFVFAYQHFHLLNPGVPRYRPGNSHYIPCPPHQSS